MFVAKHRRVDASGWPLGARTLLLVCSSGLRLCATLIQLTKQTNATMLPATYELAASGSRTTHE